VADSVSADKVANFLRKILGMVAGALQRLGHKNDLQAAWRCRFSGFSMCLRKIRLRRRSISRPSAARPRPVLHRAQRKRRPRSVNIFSSTVAMRVRSRVSWDQSANRRLRAAGKTQQQVADALQTNHDFHAGQQFASFCPVTWVMAAVTPRQSPCPECRVLFRALEWKRAERRSQWQCPPRR